MKKANTIKLQGNSEYAKVAERTRLFREDTVRGDIKTSHETLEDGRFIFKANVKKDKSDPSSAEATGHALGAVKGQKDFEKLETIAVGRALANLGYLASGEIASFEEMEEYENWKEEQSQKVIDDGKKKLEACKDLDHLKKAWSALPVEAKMELEEVKENVKKKLDKPEVNNENK